MHAMGGEGLTAHNPVDLWRKRTSRRTLLRRAAYLGVSTPVLAGLLAACGSDQDDDDPDNSAEPTTEERAAEPTSIESAADPTAEESAAEPTSEEEPEAPATTEGESASPEEEAKYGGTLRVAVAATPPTLDAQVTAPAITRTVGHHFFETLLAYDEEYVVSPGLAEAWEWSEDGLTLTLQLRQGVKFHDGNELTSADVIASIRRYAEIGARGPVIGEFVEDYNAPDDHTAEVILHTVNSGFATTLASPLVFLAIMPAANIEGKGIGELQLEDIIGTGPYKVAEWTADVSLRLERFDDYYMTDGEGTGYTGAKRAYFDELEFVTVVETGTRVSGLLAGDYDYIQDAPVPELPRLENDSDVSPVIGGPGSRHTMEINHAPEAGWSANLTFRQAMQAAIDVQQVADLLTAGNSQFYDINPSLYRRAQTAWWTDVASDLLYQANLERAQELLAESGYDGEELIIMTTPEEAQRTIAIAVSDQLGNIGVNSTIVEYDRPTWQAAFGEPTGWQMAPNGYSLRFDPSDWAATWRCGTRANWCNEEHEAQFDALAAAFDYEDQRAASDEIQRITYEEVNALQFVDTFDLSAARANIQGFKAWYLERFWNVWREE